MARFFIDRRIVARVISILMVMTEPVAMASSLAPQSTHTTQRPQASSQLPPEVVNQGVTVKKSVMSPLALFVLHSPKGTYDELFLSNYAYVNLNDPMTRVPGIGQVTVFGANKYAIRFWVNPDTLAKLDITVNEIVRALQAQNTVNPAGQLGGKPVPRGQEFTYTVLAQGRLASVEDFENVVVRATPDGSIVRVRDVARVDR